MKQMVEVEKIFCDECKKEVVGEKYHCSICGKDLCKYHVVWIYRSILKDSTIKPKATSILTVCGVCEANKILTLKEK